MLQLIKDEEHICGITKAEAAKLKRKRKRKNSFAKVRK
jgi:hypothetical protein